MSKRTRRVKDVKEQQRAALAAYRKGALVARGLVYRDICRLAQVSYSMADKWCNARRASRDCEAAFAKLTGLPAFPPESEQKAS